MPPKIKIDHEKIAEFCRKHHIRKLWLFGSVRENIGARDKSLTVYHGEKAPRPVPLGHQVD